jgi:hypothetical protein
VADNRRAGLIGQRESRFQVLDYLGAMLGSVAH